MVPTRVVVKKTRVLVIHGEMVARSYIHTWDAIQIESEGIGTVEGSSRPESIVVLT
jgi:hypothetical protein